MAKSSCTLVALLCLYFLLLSSTNLKAVEAGVCQRYSGSWEGVCIFSSNCNTQCIERESAKYGACHSDDNGLACFCYFDC
ncbi:Knottin scorpion toxin-like superfamily [Arabidopsis thaliana x Arabidopsis arenosa]|uniref:Knottin scorpion toxin-like superfamily n=2 Tax=Arabidopsis TaxID=3701 RepID=A0A8T1YEH5_ARASU|nr:Knottin scorpion toxin-like superfamily [Arabidopsis thaliana x Arabidopsis arenosa]KAG7544527.1 Knottin scorpion toxin-like superfamily [Arabidopsis suecica]